MHSHHINRGHNSALQSSMTQRARRACCYRQMMIVFLLFVGIVFGFTKAQTKSAFDLCQYNLERGNSSQCLLFVQSTFGLIFDGDNNQNRSSYETAKAIEELENSEKLQVCMAVRQLPMIRHKCCVYFEKPCENTFKDPVRLKSSTPENSDRGEEKTRTVNAVNQFVRSMTKSELEQPILNPGAFENYFGTPNSQGSEARIFGQLLQYLSLLLNPQGVDRLQPGQGGGGTGKVSLFPTSDGRTAVSVDEIGGLFATLAQTVQGMVNSQQRNQQADQAFKT